MTADSPQHELTVDEIKMQYIKPVYGADCGPFGAKVLYFRNVHPRIAIRITVRHHWIYNGEQREEIQEHVLPSNPNAGPGVSPLDTRMGCPIPGPTGQRFHWDVTDARPA